MKIRKATLADSAELARLHKGTIRSINKTDYSPEQIRVWAGRTSAKRFRDSHALAIRYVAIEKGEIIGFADFKKENPEIFWGLYVHKNHLGKGVGSKLMKKMEAVAKKMNANKFNLSATITAKSFYEKHGFTVIKKGKHPIENQMLDIYVMEKIFAPNTTKTNRETDYLLSSKRNVLHLRKSIQEKKRGKIIRFRNKI